MQLKIFSLMAASVALVQGHLFWSKTHQRLTFSEVEGLARISDDQLRQTIYIQNMSYGEWEVIKKNQALMHKFLRVIPSFPTVYDANHPFNYPSKPEPYVPNNAQFKPEEKPAPEFANFFGRFNPRDPGAAPKPEPGFFTRPQFQPEKKPEPKREPNPNPFDDRRYKPEPGKRPFEENAGPQKKPRQDSLLSGDTWYWDPDSIIDIESEIDICYTLTVAYEAITLDALETEEDKTFAFERISVMGYRLNTLYAMQESSRSNPPAGERKPEPPKQSAPKPFRHVNDLPELFETDKLDRRHAERRIIELNYLITDYRESMKQSPEKAAEIKNRMAEIQAAVGKLEDLVKRLLQEERRKFEQQQKDAENEPAQQQKNKSQAEQDWDAAAKKAREDGTASELCKSLRGIKFFPTYEEFIKHREAIEAIPSDTERLKQLKAIITRLRGLPEKSSHWEVLGISKNDKAEDARFKAKKLLTLVHPDKTPQYGDLLRPYFEIIFLAIQQIN